MNRFFGPVPNNPSALPWTYVTVDVNAGNAHVKATRPMSLSRLAVLRLAGSGAPARRIEMRGVFHLQANDRQCLGDMTHDNDNSPVQYHSLAVSASDGLVKVPASSRSSSGKRANSAKNHRNSK
jgi:hypothetical protein